MSENPSVGIVIVNFNGFNDTARCLKSLEKMAYDNFFVVVVDNDSPDGSGKKLKAEFSSPKVEVLLNCENRGFAAGNNFGIAHAVSRGAHYIWLLNADTTIEADSLSELLYSAARERDAGAFGSKILYGDLGDLRKIWSAGGVIDFNKSVIEMRGCGDIDVGQFNSVFDCDYLPGCSVLVRASVLEQVGMMPEDYFMYFEETDWCQKIKKLGYRLVYVPKSLVYHHFDDRKMSNSFTVYYYNRNSRIFWFRHSGVLGRVKIYLTTLVCDLPRAIKAYKAAPNSEMQQIFQSHISSYADFLLFRTGRRQS